MTVSTCSLDWKFAKNLPSLTRKSILLTVQNFRGDAGFCGDKHTMHHLQDIISSCD
jgi:hypothetical protein